MNRSITSLFLILLFFFTSCRSKRDVVSNLSKQAHTKNFLSRKFEMRAVWWPTIFRSEYMQMTPEEMRNDFIAKLDYLKKIGFNTVIFQVRPESDLWYPSDLEPWSRYVTGVQGRAPSPFWDPVAFLLEECHKRAMEFHAWINPYRASTSSSSVLDSRHPYNVHPEWFVRYNGQLLYDPSLPQSRDHLCRVVAEMVERYDIDAVHMDDYFYPYPQKSLAPFPDAQRFAMDPRGFTDIADWRRDNVNLLIEALHKVIRSIRPHTRFGISPFGIYRNIKSYSKGSRTNGLQNYDDLYADILLWDRKGWVDYFIPQIYWEMGHKAADFTELATWWQRHIKHAHYYIGQDVKRTMNRDQLHPKMVIAQEVSQGICMWPGDEVFKDYKRVANRLRSEYWQYPSLVPSYPGIPAEGRVRNIHLEKRGSERLLCWDAPDTKPGDQLRYYVVYAFINHRGKKDRSDPIHIVSLSPSREYRLPRLDGRTRVTYQVSYVNKYNSESTRVASLNVVI